MDIDDMDFSKTRDVNAMFEKPQKLYCRCNGSVDKILHEFISSS
jgi:hypothetical protein